jgi:hypothetical protein
MMRARTFAFALIACSLLPVLATAVTNIVIDPQLMFRTGIVSGQLNPNTRYQSYLDYLAHAQDVDGLLFGASRGTVFDPASVARATGAKRVAPFAFSSGATSDALPFLQFVLRNKAERGGEPLRHVLLLLERDNFGARPYTNVNIEGFLPPEVSGESAVRFWMRYLLAVQVTTWRTTLKSHARQSATARSTIRLASLRDGLVARDDAFDHVVPSGLLWQTSLKARDDAEAGRLQQKAHSRAPFLGVQLGELARIIELCRRHDIKLTVAVGPLTDVNARLFEPGYLAWVADRINEISDIWDFDSPPWLAAGTSTYWFESSHYKPPVADMMLQRMFGTGTAVPADFGRLRPRAAR